MALPTVKFNTSTGSDTQASGAGPATAIFGTGGSTANSNVVTLSVDAPNLSGVATDGSAVLWLQASTGRQFSKITATDNTAKTVTCEDTYTNTEGSRTWAIGGKRATINATTSRSLFGAAGAAAGWIIELEDNQTTNSAITLASSGDTTTGNILVRGASDSPRPIINNTANTVIFTANVANIVFESLHFTNSNATKTSAYTATSTNSRFVMFRNCIFGDATNRLQSAVEITGTSTYFFVDCEIKETASHGITTTGNSNILLENVWIHDAQGTGAGFFTSATATLDAARCLIEGNAGIGIDMTTGVFTLQNCTIHGNGSDGVRITGLAGLLRRTWHSNSITGNGGYGINNTGSNVYVGQMVNYNNYGTGATANTSGALNNITAGANDLAVDPGYVSVAGNNFAPGVSVRALGWPAAARTIGANQSSTTSYQDIGVAQRKEGARVLVRT